MNHQDVFPSFSNGYFADVRIVGYHLRLFAHLTEAGAWASSVYSMHRSAWITKERSADDAQHAKTEAEDVARELLPGKHQIHWRTIAAKAPAELH
jgi:hypothetical protein